MIYVTIILKIVGRPSLVMRASRDLLRWFKQVENLARPVVLFFLGQWRKKNVKRVKPRGFRAKLPKPTNSQNQREPPRKKRKIFMLV
jgi:hypothetical protein